MKSMTGFGIGKASTPQLDLEVSVKTVNGRFFEFKPHMSREFAELEAEIKNTLKQVIHRGSVDLYVNRKYKEDGKKITVEANPELAKAWVKGFKKISQSMSASVPVSVDVALAPCPDLLKVEEKPNIDKQAKQAILDCVSKAAKNCDKERAREGAALKKELHRLLAQLEKQVQMMEKQKKQALEALKARYEERLNKLGMPAESDPQRIAQEVVIQVDKADIQEELARLNEHMRAFKVLADKPGSIGKKLDFYTQELLREVNTIGSKSQVAKLTAAVVEAKSIVERIREQVQNIE